MEKRKNASKEICVICIRNEIKKFKRYSYQNKNLEKGQFKEENIVREKKDYIHTCMHT